MSFSYSGNPSASQKDEVRFLLGDTVASKAMMTNNEINYLITSEGGPVQAAIAGALQLAAKFSRQCDETVGKVSKDYSQRSKAYLALADRLKRKLAQSNSFTPFGGGISVADKEARENDADRVKPVFTKKLHNANIDYQRDFDEEC